MSVSDRSWDLGERATSIVNVGVVARSSSLAARAERQIMKQVLPKVTAFGAASTFYRGVSVRLMSDEHEGRDL